MYAVWYYNCYHNRQASMKSCYIRGLSDDSNKPTTVRLRKSDREVVCEIRRLTGQGLSAAIRSALRFYLNHLRSVFNHK